MLKTEQSNLNTQDSITLPFATCKRSRSWYTPIYANPFPKYSEKFMPRPLLYPLNALVFEKSFASEKETFEYNTLCFIKQGDVNVLWEDS